MSDVCVIQKQAEKKKQKLNDKVIDNARANMCV